MYQYCLLLSISTFLLPRHRFFSAPPFLWPHTKIFPTAVLVNFHLNALERLGRWARARLGTGRRRLQWPALPRADDGGRQLHFTRNARTALTSTSAVTPDADGRALGQSASHLSVLDWWAPLCHCRARDGRSTSTHGWATGHRYPLYQLSPG